MNKGGSKLQRFLKAISKSFVYFIFILIFLITLIGIVSRSSIVQTYLINLLSDKLKDDFGIEAEIGKFYLSGFKTINLEDVLIRDHKNDSLIYVKKLDSEVSLLNIFKANSIDLGDVHIRRARFFLRQYQGDSIFNINYFVERFASNTPDTSSSTAVVVSADQIKLYDSFFLLENQYDTSEWIGFNPSNFQLKAINGSIRNFYIEGDSLSANIDSLYLIENNSKEPVSFTNTKLNLSSGKLIFDEIHLKYANTLVQNSLIMKADTWEEWVDFNENVFMEADLTSSKLNLNDIHFFLPASPNEKMVFNVSGHYKGKINGFSLKDFNIEFKEKTFMNGSIVIDGLPEVENAIISLNVNKSNFNAADFLEYFDTTFYSTLKNINEIQLKGKFDGFYYDFVADGTFDSKLGTIITDLNFKIPENAPARYSGKAKTRNFQLGKLLGLEELIQTINLTASLEGSGLDQHSADLKINAHLRNSSFVNHKYDQIDFDAHLKENLFDGNLSILDSAAKLSLNGLINLNPNKEKVDIKGEIVFADLYKINLSDKPSTIKAKMDLDFDGISLDQSSGYANIKDLEVNYGGKFVFIDTLGIVSTLEDSIRDINIYSDLFTASLNGNFKLKTMFADIKTLIYEYEIQLKNKQSLTEEYYVNKAIKENKYNATWQFNLKNVNPLSSLFFPQLFISQNTLMTGAIQIGETEIFNLYTNIDTLIYESNQFYNNEIDISTSKFSNSNDILAFVLIDSKKQVFQEKFEGETLRIETLWNNRFIDFSLEFLQKDSENLVRLGGNTEFEIDSTLISFNSSDFKIFESNWSIKEESLIKIKGKVIEFENFHLNSEYESIGIKGKLSPNSQERLFVDFQEFNLRNLNPIIDRNISGVLNSNLILTNIYQGVQIFGDLNANDCTIEGFLIGDVSGRSFYDQPLNAIVIDFNINRLGIDIMEIKGQLQTNPENTEFNLIANLNKTKLNLIEPFSEGVISDIKGNASGYLTLKGNSSQPELKGNVKISGGKFKVDYLNTSYSFEDELIFDTDNIMANNLILKDQNGNEATLSGGIYHDGFANAVIDLNVELNEFHVLNTRIEDNTLYYGNAFASGKLNFLGSFDDIQISGDMKSEKGTYIHIPLDNYTELEKQSHITFLSDLKKNELINISQQENIDLSGLSMNFNLTLTQDAKIEIILDRQTGDIIKGQGNGQLSLEIDTRGDFNMFGFYEIIKGSYNFTLLNIVNKEFTIEPGGNISWAGDPYQGQLNLTGAYQQNVSLKPLMVSADSVFYNSPQATRRHPVNVELKLTGPLLSPDFLFGIKIKDPPIYQGYDFNNDLLAFQNRLQTDQDFLNRQVFSLIVLKQFSQNQASIQDPAGKNLSELFTNQLSNYLSSVNEKLEVNFDLSGLSQEDLNDLQLRLSYSFLEGRLRITREGGFTNSTNETDVTSIIGDWTIEYALTDDGRLKAKMFNRNNQNIYQPGTQATNTTGVSILYTKTFDDFMEFISKENKTEDNKPKEKIVTKPDAVIKEEDVNKDAEEQW